MNKTTTIRLFKISSLLLISAILITSRGPAGNDFAAAADNALISRGTIGTHQKSGLSLRNKIDELRRLFAEETAANGEKTYSAAIKNGRFSIGPDGLMVYNYASESDNLRLEEFFVGATVNPSGLETSKIPFKNLTGKNDGQTDRAYYKKIGLGEIYKGVTVTLKPVNKGVEKIITVNPDANPGDIKIGLRGHKNLSVGSNGELIITMENGGKNTPLKFSKPVAWQTIRGERKNVEIGYAVFDDETYGFRTGAYDPAYKLIIDPILYSTFVGGENAEEYTAENHLADHIMVIAVDPADSQEYVYVTGYVGTSGDFPGDFLPAAEASARGSHDIFLAKLPLDLSEISAAVLLGGNNSDIYSSVTADSSGNIYVAFNTTSTDLPTTASSYQQTFGGGGYDIGIIKLPPSLASITAATYLGGNKTDEVGNFAVKNGYLYITGTSSNLGGGNTFPVAPTSGDDEVYNHTAGGSGYEIFISRLNDQLSNTYYAGTFIQTGMTFPAITIHSVDAVPANDKVFVTGTTDADLEIIDGVNAYQPSFGGGSNDNFIARFSSNLTALEASTFIGGSEASNGIGSITIYDAGSSNYRIIASNDVLNGSTFFSALRGDLNNKKYDYDENPNNGVLNGCAEDDAWVGNFNYALTEASVALVCGDDSDYNNRLAVDSTGNVYLAMNTTSTNFPTTADAYRREPLDYMDVGLAKLPNDLSSLTTASYFGGADSSDWYAKGLGFDATGNFYLTGQTYSMDFPSTYGAVRSYKESSDSDYFITAFTNTLTSPCAPLSDNEDTDGAGPISAVSEQCLGVSVTTGPAYFENVPASFSFPAKYATSIAQSSFSNTETDSTDILTIRDLAGTGGFDVTVQASTLTNGFETIPLTNLYIVTTAPEEADLNTLDPNLNGTTTAEQITYAAGSLGQNISAAVKTTAAIDYPATYLTDGETFASGPVTIMSAESAEHFLRASQALSFYLNIPANTTPGTYSTIFTIDLIQG